MVCEIKFKTKEAEQRFLKWVDKGNLKSQVLGQASFFLRAKIKQIDEMSYLFCWQHEFLIPMTLFLYLGFNIVMLKIRKDVVIKTINKVKIFNLMG